MRAFVCIILLVALVSGCESQPQAPGEAVEPKFDSPSGPVTVLDLVRNEQEKKIEATILVGGCERRLTIMRPEGAPLPVGFCAELTDSDRNLLFGLQLAWDPDTPDRVWLKEETDSDWLTLLVQSTGDRKTENYNVNGEAFSVEYPIVDSELSPCALIDSVRSESMEEATPEVKELAAKFADFERFYGPHVGNTLHNNPDGEVLVSLVSDEDFVSYAVGEADATKRVDGKKLIQAICAVAVVCRTFKCPFFGPANPVCDACATLTLVCVYLMISEWLFGK